METFQDLNGKFFIFQKQSHYQKFICPGCKTQHSSYITYTEGQVKCSYCHQQFWYGTLTKYGIIIYYLSQSKNFSMNDLEQVYFRFKASQSKQNPPLNQGRVNNPNNQNPMGLEQKQSSNKYESPKIPHQDNSSQLQNRGIPQEKTGQQQRSPSVDKQIKEVEVKAYNGKYYIPCPYCQVLLNNGISFIQSTSYSSCSSCKSKFYIKFCEFCRKIAACSQTNQFSDWKCRCQQNQIPKQSQKQSQPNDQSIREKPQVGQDNQKICHIFENNINSSLNCSNCNGKIRNIKKELFVYCPGCKQFIYFNFCGTCQKEAWYSLDKELVKQQVCSLQKSKDVGTNQQKVQDKNPLKSYKTISIDNTQLYSGKAYIECINCKRQQFQLKHYQPEQQHSCFQCNKIFFSKICEICHTEVFIHDQPLSKSEPKCSNTLQQELDSPNQGNELISLDDSDDQQMEPDILNTFLEVNAKDEAIQLYLVDSAATKMSINCFHCKHLHKMDINVIPPGAMFDYECSILKKQLHFQMQTINTSQIKQIIVWSEKKIWFSPTQDIYEATFLQNNIKDNIFTIQKLYSMTVFDAQSNLMAIKCPISDPKKQREHLMKYDTIDATVKCPIHQNSISCVNIYTLNCCKTKLFTNLKLSPEYLQRLCLSKTCTVGKTNSSDRILDFLRNRENFQPATDTQIQMEGEVFQPNNSGPFKVSGSYLIDQQPKEQYFGFNSTTTSLDKEIAIHHLKEQEQLMCHQCQKESIQFRSQNQEKDKNFCSFQCQNKKAKKLFYFITPCREVCMTLMSELFDQTFEQKKCEQGCCVLYARCSCNEVLPPLSMFNLRKSEPDLNSHVVCQKCKKKTFYIFCKCGSLILQPEKQFTQGQIITCPNQQCDLKQLQLVQCPNANCPKGLNLWANGEYVMGSPVQCLSCKTQFQQVTCNNCLDSLYFDGDYKPGKIVKCGTCQIQKAKSGFHFQCITCAYCHTPKYFRECDLLIGQPYRCDHCLLDFYYANCPDCMIPLLENQQPVLKLLQGRFYLCTGCKTYWQFYICKICQSITMNTSKNSINQNFGEISCNNPRCNMKGERFYLIKCPRVPCNKVVHYTEPVESNKRVTCLECKQDFIVVQCKACKTLNGMLNKNDICIGCKQEISQDQEIDMYKGICRICYTQKANQVFVLCMHMCMCESCSKKLMVSECPLCKTPGDFRKVIM